MPASDLAIPSSSHAAASDAAVNVMHLLSDADVVKFALDSEENRGHAVEELSRRYQGLAAPHRALQRQDTNNPQDILRYFEEAERLRIMGVALTPTQAIAPQLIHAAAERLHRASRTSPFVGRYCTALEQVRQAEFIFAFVTGEGGATLQALMLRAELCAHRGESVTVLEHLSRLHQIFHGDANVCARALACIAAEQDHGDLLKCIAMLYPRSVAPAQADSGQSPMEVAIAFASKSAARALIEAGVNLTQDALRAIKRDTIGMLLRQEYAQNHSNIIQTPEAFSHERSMLERRLSVLTLCLDAVRA